MPAKSGTGRSGYSAKENTGDATQKSGTRKPIQARISRITSRVPLRLFTVLTARLRFPCGARIAIITTLAERMTAFAIQGSIVGCFSHAARSKLPTTSPNERPQIGPAVSTMKFTGPTVKPVGAERLVEAV